MKPSVSDLLEGIKDTLKDKISPLVMNSQNFALISEFSTCLQFMEIVGFLGENQSPALQMENEALSQLLRSIAEELRSMKSSDKLLGICRDIAAIKNNSVQQSEFSSLREQNHNLKGILVKLIQALDEAMQEASEPLALLRSGIRQYLKEETREKAQMIEMFLSS